MFKDSATKLVQLPSTTDSFLYLGAEYMSIIRSLKKGELRLIPISSHLLCPLFCVVYVYWWSMALFLYLSELPLSCHRNGIVFARLYCHACNGHRSNPKGQHVQIMSIYWKQLLNKSTIL